MTRVTQLALFALTLLGVNGATSRRAWAQAAAPCSWQGVAHGVARGLELRATMQA